MKASNNAEKVWDLMEKISIAMLVTLDREQMRARPMAAHLERGENAVYFLTDVSLYKDDEIENDPRICLAFADNDSQSYVSVSGEGEISNDRQRIKELWTPLARAWFSGPDDPAIRVIKVTPHDAEFWDNPGKVVTYVKMAAAAVTGQRPDIGENRKVAM
ncbi:pyridoxamine 5'-phosphate oxidase family protein [soil metagenome]